MQLFCTLKKKGETPLANHFFQATADFSPAHTLYPGQWLQSQQASVALLQQPSPHNIQLICEPKTPASFTLQLEGSPLPPPTAPTLLIAKALPGLGGLLFAAQAWKTLDIPLFALLQLDPPFPFQSTPSRIWLPGAPQGAIATLPLLEDWGIPTRLMGDFPGGFEGSLSEWLTHWHQHHPQTCQVITFNL